MARGRPAAPGQGLPVRKYGEAWKQDSKCRHIPVADHTVLMCHGCPTQIECAALFKDLNEFSSKGNTGGMHLGGIWGGIDRGPPIIYKRGPGIDRPDDAKW